MAAFVKLGAGAALWLSSASVLNMTRSLLEHEAL